MQLGYWVVGYSGGLFLQIPLLMMGVEVGVGMMVGVSEIEFWYLIVGMTLLFLATRSTWKGFKTAFPMIAKNARLPPPCQFGT
mgnify:CR=1 FL=1